MDKNIFHYYYYDTTYPRLLDAFKKAWDYNVDATCKDLRVEIQDIIDTNIPAWSFKQGGILHTAISVPSLIKWLKSDFVKDLNLDVDPERLVHVKSCMPYNKDPKVELEVLVNNLINHNDRFYALSQEISMISSTAPSNLERILKKVTFSTDRDSLEYRLSKKVEVSEADKQNLANDFRLRVSNVSISFNLTDIMRQSVEDAINVVIYGKGAAWVDQVNDVK